MVQMEQAKLFTIKLASLLSVLQKHSHKKFWPLLVCWTEECKYT